MATDIETEKELVYVLKDYKTYKTYNDGDPTSIIYNKSRQKYVVIKTTRKSSPPENEYTIAELDESGIPKTQQYIVNATQIIGVPKSGGQYIHLLNTQNGELTQIIERPTRDKTKTQEDVKLIYEYVWTFQLINPKYTLDIKKYKGGKRSRTRKNKNCNKSRKLRRKSNRRY